MVKPVYFLFRLVWMIAGAGIYWGILFNKKFCGERIALYLNIYLIVGIIGMLLYFGLYKKSTESSFTGN